MQYIRLTDRLGTTHSTDDKRQSPNRDRGLHACTHQTTKCTSVAVLVDTISSRQNLPWPHP